MSFGEAIEYVQELEEHVATIRKAILEREAANVKVDQTIDQVEVLAAAEVKNKRKEPEPSVEPVVPPVEKKPAPPVVTFSVAKR